MPQVSCLRPGKLSIQPPHLRKLESNHDQGHLLSSSRWKRKAYGRLASFFSALGFAAGKGWNEEDRAAEFPSWPRSATLNLSMASFPPPPTSWWKLSLSTPCIKRPKSGSARKAASRVARLSPISETHWKSHIFTVEPEPGFSSASGPGPIPSRQAPGGRRRSIRRGHAFRHRSRPLECRHHRAAARRRARRAAAQRRHALRH